MEFPEPPGMVWADVDPWSGLAIPAWMAGERSYKEVFREDNIPMSSAYKLWRWMFPEKKAEPEPAEEPEPEAGPLET